MLKASLGFGRVRASTQEATITERNTGPIGWLGFLHGEVTTPQWDRSRGLRIELAVLFGLICWSLAVLRMNGIFPLYSAR